MFPNYGNSSFAASTLHLLKKRPSDYQMLRTLQNEMGWTCGMYWWGEGVYRFLVGKPERRRPLWNLRRRWVDNTRKDLLEVGCGYMDWIGLAQDRDSWRTLVSAVKNLRIPWNVEKFLTSCKPVSFSRRTLHHGVSNGYPIIKENIFQLCHFRSWEKPTMVTLRLQYLVFCRRKRCRVFYYLYYYYFKVSFLLTKP